MRLTSLALLIAVAFLASCTSMTSGQDAAPGPDVQPQAPTVTQSAPSPQPKPQIGTTDLSALASAWSTHDADAIRALYADDGKYFTAEDMLNLRDERPNLASVADASFPERVHAYDGMTMRILGEPIMIYDKLVAFAYRWEGASSGYNGAALLRFEDGKIFLHADLTSHEPTPKGSGNSDAVAANLDLSPLMRAWNSADLEAAGGLYQPNAVILSDEDLAQAPWRDFAHPPRIDELLLHFRGWDPSVAGTPLQVDNLVIFAWHWGIREFPVGWGVRLLQIGDSAIDTDIRFAIRPWEPRGNSFMTP